MARPCGESEWYARFRRRSFIQKDIKSYTIPQDANSNGFAKVLGPAQLVFLGVGSVVGAGIYVLAGITAHNTAGYASTCASSAFV